MRVTVRLFAQLRDAAGLGTWEAEMPAGAIVGDVWRQATTRHPAIAPFERAISCAVNATFARMTHPVADGDEVAFLPPVSGG
jgi:molybdopterin converting factor subunit 1